MRKYSGWDGVGGRAGGREAKGFLQPGRKVLSSVSKYKTKMPGTETRGPMSAGPDVLNPAACQLDVRRKETHGVEQSLDLQFENFI